ncbi:hypothetical protein O6H91_01G081300 [Diphasiastrum complanatum]|uniref:Uncharacterized protein n=5 Tax=Diphasiastrum complanatum TaxID=34168 RepID=A0ACC2ESL0_DIPCM|nr:hypothetical protein O6H91_01G081300 [Diphasiastrum complanatum]KAJ7569502.1 hypothetical protein O6H91_01G081300 [Diphasiastrum complanatum]
MGQERKKDKGAMPSYNAVPPPSSLYSPSPSPSSLVSSPAPIPSAASSPGPLEKPKQGSRGTGGSEHEIQKKWRKRPIRKSRQGPGGGIKHSGPQDGSESGGGSNSDENAENKNAKHTMKELSAQINSLSLLRSPSPSAMPNPRFTNKSREQYSVSSVSTGTFSEPKSRQESCSVDLATFSGMKSSLCFDGINSSSHSVEENYVACNHSREASPGRFEYVPMAIPKLKPAVKWRDHWPIEEVSKALEAGEVFKSVLRVNMFNRNEAYATLKGVPIDILIDGLDKQNRAMEGDTVAVQLDPVSFWCRLKGSNNNKQNPNATCFAKDQCRGGLESYPSTGSESCIQERADTEDSDHHISADQVQDEAQSSSSSAVNLQGHAYSFPSKKIEVQQMHVEMVQSESSTVNGARGPSAVFEPDLQALQSLSNVVDIGHLQCQNYKGKAMPEGVLTRSDSLSENENSEVISTALAQVTAILDSMPNKRPTGKVVHILEKSSRRRAIVGFLDVNLGNKHVARGSGQWEDSSQKYRKKAPPKAKGEKLMLIPADNRFPKMVVFVKHLPDDVKKRLQEGDATVGSELLAAQVDEWKADSEFPSAVIKQSLGQGGEIEAQTAAILFQHAIHSAVFPPACHDCLPQVPWKIPDEELWKRKDLRACRIFSIDPPTAKDLDDALSIERLDDDLVRVGVHIADVSFFVPPDSALDKEAQNRSTSVYLIQRVLPMLPGLLCEELCSLNPGVDRLAFSVIWDLNSSGHIVDQWIGRTIIRSCCKLTYGHAQDMLDGLFDTKDGQKIGITEKKTLLPELHGEFSWEQIIGDIRALHGIAKRMRELRFEGGALKLDNSKLLFVLDGDGNPCDSIFYEHKESNMVVEEFMLLANMTVAKVISGVFPECALLRRHPEPNLRKLKEFEEFCSKNGFELDTSSAGALQLSLEKLREALKHDPVLFSVLLLYATKPMQLAKYFCTGELRDSENEWAHYALATPFYTHFTSPIRRYPDIVVHRTLAAALEAEEIICGVAADIKESGSSRGGFRCFSGPALDKEAAELSAGQGVLAMVADKYKVPQLSELVAVAAHCNERKLASRNVREATDKLFLWAMVKRNQGLLSDARVLNVGPKFMSVYVSKIAMERRIYYDEIDGLKAEWLEAIGSLVLDIAQSKLLPQKHCQGKTRNSRDVAVLVNPAHHKNQALEIDGINEVEERVYSDKTQVIGSEKEIEPAVLPIILRPFSSVPVSLHAVGGENRPVDVGVRLYLSSYLY